MAKYTLPSRTRHLMDVILDPGRRHVGRRLHSSSHSIVKENNHLHAYKDVDPNTPIECKYLRGFLAGPLMLVPRAPGRLDLYARGRDDHLWHLAYWNSRWSKAVSRCLHNTPTQGQPEAISTGSESLEFVALGASGDDDDALLHATYDDAARVWTPTASAFRTIAPGLVGSPQELRPGQRRRRFRVRRPDPVVDSSARNEG